MIAGIQLLGFVWNLGDQHIQVKHIQVLWAYGLEMEENLNGVQMVMLVDTGASHSFISPWVTTALGVRVQKHLTMRVGLVDGHRVPVDDGEVHKSGGSVRGFHNWGCRISSYVFEGDLDMFLGTALEMDGQLLIHYESHKMMEDIQTKSQPCPIQSLWRRNLERL